MCLTRGQTKSSRRDASRKEEQLNLEVLCMSPQFLLTLSTFVSLLLQGMGERRMAPFTAQHPGLAPQLYSKPAADCKH